MNYYPFHIGDYAAHTKSLSHMEDLAYRRLLDAYYLTERPLNGCPSDVAREIGMREQLADVEYVLGRFFEHDGDCWRNCRADKVIAAFHDKSEKAARAGRASAERRSNVRSTSVEKNPVSVEQMATDVQPTNNQEPRATSTTDVVDKPQRVRAAALPCPDDVQPDTWADYLAVRKAKKAPMTATALEGVQREADKAGMTLQQALALCCARGWAGFRADWVADIARPAVTPAQTYRERDAEAGMRRWEELTGQRHPDRDRASGVVINATTTTMKLLETAQ